MRSASCRRRPPRRRSPRAPRRRRPPRRVRGPRAGALERAARKRRAPARPPRERSGRRRRRSERRRGRTTAGAGHPVPRPRPGAGAPERKRKDTAALAPGLARTRSGFIARLRDVFAGRKELDPSIVDEIEKVLLTADIGVRTSPKLLEEIRTSLSRRELADPDAVWAFLRRRSAEMLSLPAPELDFGSAHPFVLLIIGVNGSGKTTTIGKLAAKLGGDGKKVLLAAGDTFRAAAVEQLEIWAGRTVGDASCAARRAPIRRR